MNYDFSSYIERRGSGDLMHEALKPRWGRDDLHPMWVADMGFAVCPAITDALRRRIEHPIFGYTRTPREWYPAIHDWVLSHHGWDIKREWLSYIPGIVKGIGMVINVFVKPDEKVIVMPPVYHPFFLTPRANGREVVWNPLKRVESSSYTIDFDNLEAVCDDKCRLLILCNPHNPAGICWDSDTLRRLADFCASHNILVISDEIHCDLALSGHKHTPFATVSQTAADISITFQAPSKTFNIAGIVSSYAIVPNTEIRDRFFGWLKANELDEAPIFADVATVAAYTEGEEWRQQLLAYLQENIQFVEDYCLEHIPQIHPVRPEASFLVWLDCRELGLNHEQLLDLFIDKAHLALNDGEMFGPGGEGYMRMNIGSPRSYVEQGLKQLAEAVKMYV
jgi:cystathionine beta-lyase